MTILVENILEISEEQDDFSIAKQEWKLRGVYKKPKSTCLCNHYPITNCCIIVNKINNTETMVGNCCLNHFTGIPNVDWYFQGLKSIQLLKNPNIKMIKHLKKKNKLSVYEYEFLLNRHRKKKYSIKQTEFKEKILRRLQ
jgi:hypothetical protein